MSVVLTPQAADWYQAMYYKLFLSVITIVGVVCVCGSLSPPQQDRIFN